MNKQKRNIFVKITLWIRFHLHGHCSREGQTQKCCITGTNAVYRVLKPSGYVQATKCILLARLCPTLCNLLDWGLRAHPVGFSSTILGVVSHFQGIFLTRDQTQVSLGHSSRFPLPSEPPWSPISCLILQKWLPVFKPQLLSSKPRKAVVALSSHGHSIITCCSFFFFREDSGRWPKCSQRLWNFAI